MSLIISTSYSLIIFYINGLWLLNIIKYSDVHLYARSVIAATPIKHHLRPVVYRPMPWGARDHAESNCFFFHSDIDHSSNNQTKYQILIPVEEGVSWGQESGTTVWNTAASIGVWSSLCPAALQIRPARSPSDITQLKFFFAYFHLIFI